MVIDEGRPLPGPPPFVPHGRGRGESFRAMGTRLGMISTLLTLSRDVRSGGGAGHHTNASSDFTLITAKKPNIELRRLKGGICYLHRNDPPACGSIPSCMIDGL